MFKWLSTKDKQIESLKKDVEFWQGEYNDMCERKNCILNDYGKRGQEYAELVSENERLKGLVHGYKQKYADELQKRLELAKLIDRIEACKSIELKVNSDDEL